MLNRIRIKISGTVQGIGFRPFVYHLATSYNLNGWIINDNEGVTIDLEGQPSALNQMIEALKRERPPYASYEHFEIHDLEPAGYLNFKIRESDQGGTKKVFMLPDIATCPECLEEVFDPQNPRYLYPFTNCTHCGPRYSIIKDLPYDRQNTTMIKFKMCKHCEDEYDNPDNRRFHAQPNACPECGPHLELWDKNGKAIYREQEAMQQAAEAIKKGKILALKGLGGFQLLADASNQATVDLLRRRKNREEKPFALMVASLEMAHELCSISIEEEGLLKSPESPIVILNRKKNPGISLAASVAPEFPTLGLMLPYTPLHHILMKSINIPIVATSGNISDEPICTEESDALERLYNIADFYLVHDRPIERHVDDSVVRMIAGEPTVLRLARGYAPHHLTVAIEKDLDETKNTSTFLALGGHLKNSIAINRGTDLFLSQHIGDLDNYEATKAYHKVVDDLPRIYDLEPDLILHDQHPDYYTSKDALNRNKPAVKIQHHYAHILSCMAEHKLKGISLGVAWDGTGYGNDGTTWGGEFMLCDERRWERFATFRRFRLPGGDEAMREPRRIALGLLFELFGTSTFKKSNLPTLKAFSNEEIKITKTMLEKNINTPVTTSAGRLFDAIASILGVKQKISYEGQAAMALEHLIPEETTGESYHFEITVQDNRWVIDWEPMLRQILNDLPSGNLPLISNKFHNTLSDMIVAIATRTGEKTVILSGGCFQNAYLTARTVNKLKKLGFRPYWNHQIPSNDGGIAAGQLYYAICNSDEIIKSTRHEVSG